MDELVGAGILPCSNRACVCDVTPNTIEYQRNDKKKITVTNTRAHIHKHKLVCIFTKKIHIFLPKFKFLSDVVTCFLTRTHTYMHTDTQTYSLELPSMISSCPAARRRATSTDKKLTS